MKRALLIHYHFLPVLHVGVKHLLGHARHLPTSGWDPTVLTRVWHEARADDGHWGLSWEPDLEASLGGVPRIHRVEEPRRAPRRLPRREDPILLRKALSLRHLLAGNYPDAFVSWIAPAVDAAAALHGQAAFDAILSYCPPETNVVAGSRLARRLGIPHVVYFGDLYGFHIPAPASGPGALVRALAHRRWMRSVSACAAVSPAMAAYVQRTYGVPADLVSAGFDEAEFGGAVPARAADRMLISHVGSIYPHLQRPGILFDGLDAFLAHHPEAATRLVVRLVGTKCDDTLRTLLRDRPCAAVCDVLPKVASRHAVDLVRASDAVLAFSLVESHGLGTLSYPSKVFEAFGAKRRVLLIPSDGDWVDRLLKETGCGTPADDAQGVARVLSDWYGEWTSTGTLAPCGRPDALAAYTLAAQARLLAAVLDRAIASPRRVSWGGGTVASSPARV